MSKKKTRQEYKDMILTVLGDSIVDIELEDIGFDKIFKLVFMKIKPRIGTTKFMTIPIANSINLKPMKVYAVINVYRSSPVANGYGESTSSSSMYSDAILFNPSLLLTGISGYNNSLNRTLGITASDNVAISLLTTQLINQASGRSSDIDFEFDDGVLYVETTGAGTESITLEYIPDYESIEEIEEPFWQNFFFDMSLAYSKIAIGRARSKYRLSNLPYELDGEALIQEGNQELERLNELLKEENDIFYFLD